MKRFLSIILSILMLLSAFVPFSAFAETSSGTWGEDGTWELNNGVLTYTGTGGIRGFRGSDEVKKLIINEGATSIGEDAFRDCINLEDIELPTSLKLIDKSAFNNCISLKKLEIPSGVTSIRTAAFYNCDSLIGKLIIPKNVSWLGSLTFNSCDGLTSVEFEDGFSGRIGDGTFKECKNIKDVYFPGSSQTATGFVYCNSLTKVTICEGVETIGGFACCPSLTTINFPKSAKTIDYAAFINCTNLKTVKIQGKIEYIGAEAFKGCPNFVPKFPYGVGELSFQRPLGYLLSDNGKDIPIKNFKIYGKNCKALTDYCKENGFKFIDMYDVKNATGVDISSKTYSGKAIKPELTVKLAGITLTKDTDYTVKYSNNTKVGTAKVTLTGKGKYKGTLTKTYKINPQPTELTKLTVGSKSFKAYWKKVTTQTTGYQIQYSTYKDLKNAKTVTITSNKTGARTIKNLKAKKNYFVRIRTYKTVSGKKYYSKWSESMKVTTK